MKFLTWVFLIICVHSTLPGQEIKKKDSLYIYYSKIQNGDSLYQNTKFSEALIQYRQALFINSEDSWLIEKYLECLDIVGKGCTAYRDNYDAMMELGELYFKNESYEKARDLFTRADRLFPFEIEPKLKLREIEQINTQKK